MAAVFRGGADQQHVPQMLAGFFSTVAGNKYVFLLLVNLLLLVLGMFMENSSCIIISDPAAGSIAASYGIDLIHFGVILVCNLAVGMVTPPFGLCLFMGSDLAGAKLGSTIRSLAPYLVASLAALALITLCAGPSAWG